MADPAVIAELDAMRAEVSAAVERIFDAMEFAIATLPSVRAGNTQAIAGLERSLCGVIEALSFQDITGQRMTRVAELLNTATRGADAPGEPSEVSLENGPALPGCGLSQDDADSFFANASR